jgi:beta-fructofuranosidase
MNDPYGVHWDGEQYQLFCQALPGRTTWAPGCTWARATSPDLVRWTWQGVVLEPEPFETGCWSGSVVPGHGAFYTRVTGSDLGRGVVALARWDGTRFRTSESDVVLAGPPAVPEFRDPFVVERDGAWSMVVGTGLDDGTGAVLHYRSDDLASWVYDGVLARIGGPHVRTVAECPQLVEVAGRWAVIVSVQVDHEPGPVMARFLDGADESWAPLATGAAAYATTAFRDRDGRPCAISWLRETHDVTGGWAGAQSLPGVLGADGDRITLGSIRRSSRAGRSRRGSRGRPRGSRRPFGHHGLLPRRGPAVVDAPADVVVDADVVERYAETGYAVWRSGPVHASSRLVFEGREPQVHRLA